MIHGTRWNCRLISGSTFAPGSPFPHRSLRPRGKHGATFYMTLENSGEPRPYQHGVSRSTGKNNSTPRIRFLTSASVRYRKLPFSSGIRRVRQEPVRGFGGGNSRPKAEKPSTWMAFPRDSQSLASLKIALPLSGWDFCIPAGVRSQRNCSLRPESVRLLVLRRWHSPNKQFPCLSYCLLESII
jgi:hypothetical protein